MGIATKPVPHAGGGSGPAADRYPHLHTHRSRPPSSWGKSGRWAPGRHEGQEPPDQLMVWRGSQVRGEGWNFVQNWRYWGTCSWAEGLWQGLDQDPRGQKPLTGGTGSGTGTRPQSRCWVPSELHALRPACPCTCPRGRGQHPQYGLRPESEQRAARAGSLQSRWPHGRQPLPRFLCLWHCPGVRIYSHFSQE